MQANARKSKRKGRKAPLIVLAVIFSVVIAGISLFFAFLDSRTLDFEEFFVAREGWGGHDVTIVHLSDLHFPNAVDTDKMLARIEEAEPDIIAVTGDIIGTRTVVEQSGVFEFVERLANIGAPVFFVRGNHERNNRNSQLLYDNMAANGVVILRNESVVMGDITVIGLDYGTSSATISCDEENNFVILLTHVPSFGNTLYTSEGAAIIPNLILSGHIHGGQIRIFGRGILCPDTLLFPRFAAGLYTLGESKMIVSRGIGNSIVPWRVNNMPHIPIIIFER